MFNDVGVRVPPLVLSCLINPPITERFILESKVIVLSNSEHSLEVKLQYDEISKELDEAYLEERNNIVLPGFRKGKVPISLLKKMYGEAIEYKASESISNKKFWDIAEQQKLKPIGTPQLVDIDFQINEYLSFKVKYEVKPQIELKNYKNLEIEKLIFQSKDSDIDAEIERYLKSKATFEDSDIITDDKFLIEADIQRVDENGMLVLGTRNENIKIDLSDYRTNKEIVDNVLNKKVGDNFSFTFVDEHYHGEHLHREEFNYSGTIKKIIKILIPEINDELTKEFSKNKANTPDEWKSQIKESMDNYLNLQSDEIYLDALLSKIYESNEIVPSENHIEHVLLQLLETERQEAKKNKKQFNEEQARESLRNKAENMARYQILSENIIRLENIKLDEEELMKIAEEESEKTGISSDKLLKYYKDSNLFDSMLDEKVIQFLRENNTPILIDPETKRKLENSEHQDLVETENNEKKDNENE